MIVEALTGWLGLTTLVLATLLALTADGLRQRLGSVQLAARTQRWIVGLTVAATVLAVLAAVATVLRFVTLV